MTRATFEQKRRFRFCRTSISYFLEAGAPTSILKELIVQWKVLKESSQFEIQSHWSWADYHVTEMEYDGDEPEFYNLVADMCLYGNGDPDALRLILREFPHHLHQAIGVDRISRKYMDKMTPLELLLDRCCHRRFADYFAAGPPLELHQAQCMLQVLTESDPQIWNAIPFKYISWAIDGLYSESLSPCVASLFVRSFNGKFKLDARDRRVPWRLVTAKFFAERILPKNTEIEIEKKKNTGILDFYCSSIGAIQPCPNLPWN